MHAMRPTTGLASAGRGPRIKFYNPMQKIAVKLVCKKNGWAENQDENDKWNMAWVGVPKPEFWKKLKPNQRVNYITGISGVTRKMSLTDNMRKMATENPKDYDFYPHSWTLPSEWPNLRKWAKEHSTKETTYIVKPDTGMCGKGIYLVKKVCDIDPETQSAVVQTYIDNPFLINGLKFDMRIYALVTSVNPLRVYVYDEGFARFCTKPYTPPYQDIDSSKMGQSPESEESTRRSFDPMQHLTNYSLNKDNPDFVYNTDEKRTDIGHKWSIGSLMKHLKKGGVNVDALWQQIHKIVANTLLSIHESLVRQEAHLLHRNVDGGMCFQFLGFDIMLDSKCKPWLLEVNRFASTNCDTPVDALVNVRAITDLVNIVRLERVISALAAPPPRSSGFRYARWYESFKNKKLVFNKSRIIHENKIVESTGYTLVYPKDPSTIADPILPPLSPSLQAEYPIEPPSPIHHTHVRATPIQPIITNTHLRPAPVPVLTKPWLRRRQTRAPSPSPSPSPPPPCKRRPRKKKTPKRTPKPLKRPMSLAARTELSPLHTRELRAEKRAEKRSERRTASPQKKQMIKSAKENPPSRESDAPKGGRISGPKRNPALKQDTASHSPPPLKPIRGRRRTLNPVQKTETNLKTSVASVPSGTPPVAPKHSAGTTSVSSSLPAQSEPAHRKPTKASPVNAKPANAKPVNAKPANAKPANAESIRRHRIRVLPKRGVPPNQDRKPRQRVKMTVIRSSRPPTVSPTVSLAGGERAGANDKPVESSPSASSASTAVNMDHGAVTKAATRSIVRTPNRGRSSRNRLPLSMSFTGGTTKGLSKAVREANGRHHAAKQVPLVPPRPLLSAGPSPAGSGARMIVPPQRRVHVVRMGWASTNPSGVIPLVGFAQPSPTLVRLGASSGACNALKYHLSKLTGLLRRNETIHLKLSKLGHERRQSLSWRMLHHVCSRLAVLRYQSLRRVIRFKKELDVIARKLDKIGQRGGIARRGIARGGIARGGITGGVGARFGRSLPSLSQGSCEGAFGVGSKSDRALLSQAMANIKAISEIAGDISHISATNPGIGFY